MTPGGAGTGGGANFVRDAHYYAGTALIGLGLGRPVNLVTVHAGVDWPVPATALSKWGDFLDFAHAEAMIRYGGFYGEALATSSGVFPHGQAPKDPEGDPDAGARRIVGGLLDGWRPDHPEVVAYVEEWLDLEETRRIVRTTLEERRDGLAVVAEGLLEIGALTMAEISALLDSPRSHARARLRARSRARLGREQAGGAG